MIPPQSSSIQPNCSAIRASSPSLCSSGHLASYCLIYLWLSVIGQWESIVAPISPPHFLLLAISSMLLIFLSCFCESFIRLFPVFFSYLLKSFLISLHTLLLFFPLAQNLPSPVSQSHFLPLLSTSLPLSAPIPFIINTLLNVFLHIFPFLSPSFHMFTILL